MLNKIKSSFFILKKNYKYLAVPVFLEAVFFILLGFFTRPFRTEMESNLIYLSDNIIQNVYFDIFSSSYFQRIIFFGLILVIIGYVLYNIFQGVIWRYSLNLKKKKRYLPYLKRFFIVNLFWLPIYLLYFLLNFVLTYIDLVGKTLNENYYFGQVSQILLILIAYFAFMSYVFLDEYGIWKSIKESFKIKWKYLAAFIVGFGVIAILNYLVSLTGQIALWIMLVLGVVVVMPSLIWGRLLLKEVVD